MAESTTYLHTFRVLIAALMAAPVVIVVAVAMSMGDKGTGSPPAWSFAVLVGLAVGASVLIPLLGYRPAAIPPGTEAGTAQSLSASAFQSTAILRFAIAEAVVLLAIALAFTVDEGGVLLCLVAAILYEALILLHAWPGDRVIIRVQEALEREGGTSYLREALDGPPPGRS